MLNTRSLAAVDASTWRTRFRRPLSSTYSFGNIPHAVRYLLGLDPTPGLPADVFEGLSPPFDRVVLLFLDAFGRRLMDRALERSRLLRHGLDRGVVSVLTSQFPSTTAAHVTTINTGLTPAQSGVYAWQYYEPEVGTIVEPLPYSFYDAPPKSLNYAHIDPKRLIPTPSVHERFRDEGVKSFLVHPSEIVRSPANLLWAEGATVLPYRSLAEGIVALRRVLETEPGPLYAQLYYDRIDTLSHLHTQSSAEVDAETEAVFLQFDHLLFDRVKPLSRTLVLVTADHGQMEFVPEECVYLNRDLPSLLPSLERDRFGRLLAPAGSRRDFFLHVKPEQVEGVVAALSAYLGDRAEVALTEELMNEGFFGPPPVSERLRARAGNVVILPHARQSVWWMDREPTNRGHVSSHGGLTPEEMDIPFFAIPID